MNKYAKELRGKYILFMFLANIVSNIIGSIVSNIFVLTEFGSKMLTNKGVSVVFYLIIYVIYLCVMTFTIFVLLKKKYLQYQMVSSDWDKQKKTVFIWQGFVAVVTTVYIYFTYVSAIATLDSQMATYKVSPYVDQALLKSTYTSGVAMLKFGLAVQIIIALVSIGIVVFLSLKTIKEVSLTNTIASYDNMGFDNMQGNNVQVNNAQNTPNTEYTDHAAAADENNGKQD